MYPTQKTKNTVRLLMRITSTFVLSGMFLLSAASFSVAGHTSALSLLNAHIAHAQDGGGAGGDGGGDGGSSGGDGGAGAGGDGASGDGASGNGGGDSGTGGGCCGGGGDTGGGDAAAGPGPSTGNGNSSGNPVVVVNTPVCPTGTVGTYPNCVVPPGPTCPSGTTGTYPNCVTPPGPTCPSGTTGTYPNCVTPPGPTCPSGTTGTYPNCVTPPVIGCTGYCCAGNCGGGPTPPTNPPYSFYCPAGYYGMYPHCYLPHAPVGYTVASTPPAPVISLALTSVPYTGLDLGPIGTAIYWAFIALWAVLGAYLIGIKRVQNTLARRAERFFFGA